ncbi:MAG: NADH-quinone oxidoreductase subunit J family protein [Vulcanimicrobiaceae bacterium]
MIAFAILAVVLVASALFAMAARKPVYAVVGLLANFLALAAIYVKLDAEFLGIIQVVIYSGAILMLFVFVIALLSSGVGAFPEGPDRMRWGRPAGLVAALVALGLVLWTVARTPLAVQPPPVGVPLGAPGHPNVFGSIGDFGAALFTTYLLPFEITALVLLVAVIGVVLIAGDSAPAPTLGRHHPHRRAGARAREPIAKVGK